MKQEGEKPEIKKEKMAQLKIPNQKLKKRRKTVEKEYFIYINGEKRLVRLVSGDAKARNKLMMWITVIQV